mgnify:CR=1 FL=1
MGTGNLSVWVGTGLLTAGLSAAVLAGPALAVAQAGAGSESSSDSTSAPADTRAETAKPDTTEPDATKPDTTKPDTTEPDETKPDEPKPDVDEPGDAAPEDPEPSSEPEPEPEAKPTPTHARSGLTPNTPADRPAAVEDATEPADTAADEPARADDVAAPADTAADTVETAPTPVRHEDRTRVAEPVDTEPEPSADRPSAVTALRVVSVAEPAQDSVAPVRTTILGFVTSVLFGLLTGFEQIVNGPPRLPAGSTVTVQSSSLKVTDTMTVAADWYFPDGDDPPQRLVLLQHGVLAIGPMYSYTAAQLAQDTHSIVITPTLTSNPFADGGLWLGGDGMHEAIAQLFTGDRAALTASALAAGYAERYGLDPAEACLPQKFALAGHSLGGALVSGVSKYLVRNGGVADLVGVISLDGVPLGSQLPDALAALADYEKDTGRYVPLRQIAAPWNYLNAFSNANQSLTAARPNHYNGVILTGGVHMDSMQGGNALIQFSAFLIAGFPQPQNPPAVHQLMVSWLDAWFTGTDTDQAPGPTFVIETPQGPATATVIGSPLPAITLREAQRA